MFCDQSLLVANNVTMEMSEQVLDRLNYEYTLLFMTMNNDCVHVLHVTVWPEQS